MEHEGKLLLCRRAIEPCRGKWTVPAGFMELDESTAGTRVHIALSAAQFAVSTETLSICAPARRRWLGPFCPTPSLWCGSPLVKMLQQCPPDRRGRGT